MTFPTVMFREWKGSSIITITGSYRGRLILNINPWTFLYLPTFDNSVRAVATFVPTADSGLRLYLELVNPGPIEREWEFFMYLSARDNLELSGCSHHLSENDSFECSLFGTNFVMESGDVGFTEAVETDSTSGSIFR